MKSRSVVRWAGKGFWGVLDQGLFAVSNFTLTVLLARWLTPHDYGAFTVAYTSLWFLGAFHSAMITEPMLVFGPGRYENRIPGYLRVLVYGHMGFAVLGGLLLLTVGLVAEASGSRELSFALLSLALTAPFILLQWLARRVCYMRFKPHLAASGGAVYLVLVLAGIYASYRYDWLSVALAFGLMGLASLLASLWMAVRLREVGMRKSSGDSITREVFEVHWGFARWAAPTNALMMFAGWSGSIYFLLLPIWWGLDASAALRALMNLVTPFLHANAALSMLLLPALVRARGQAEFWHLARLALAALSLGSILYWFLLGLFHQPLLAWLYGSRYAQDADLLWLLGLMPLVAVLGSVLTAILRAFERPDQAFWAYLFSAVIAVTVGFGFMVVWGVVGAVLGILASSVATVGMMMWRFVKTKASMEEQL